MQLILISACLMGERVRYHGGDALIESNILATWSREGRLIPLCPEVSAGLPTPRDPSEIVGGSGLDVLEGVAKVLKQDGKDYSGVFIKGAKMALECAQKYNIKIAILKESSPSCGSNIIYSGKFSGEKVAGMGVTAALLKKNGVSVFSENEIEKALNELQRIES